MLQFKPGRLQLFDQVGAVQQLERRRAGAGEPAFQKPPDPIAGVQAVEVVRADAERLQALARLLRLASVGFALGQYGYGLELASLLVERLLGDLDGDGAMLGEHLLGGVDSARAILGGQFQRPRGAVLAAREDFEVNLGAVHALPRLPNSGNHGGIRLKTRLRPIGATVSPAVIAPSGRNH